MLVTRTDITMVGAYSCQILTMTQSRRRSGQYCFVITTTLSRMDMSVKVFFVTIKGKKYLLSWLSTSPPIGNLHTLLECA